MVGAALLAAGCATGGSGPLAPHLESGAPEVRECAQWYQALDAEIDAAGVRDAQATRVAGFPHLRIDRTLAGLRDRAAQSEPALRATPSGSPSSISRRACTRFQNLPALPNEAARTQSVRRAQLRPPADACRSRYFGEPCGDACRRESAGRPRAYVFRERRALAAAHAGRVQGQPDESVQRVRYAPPAAQRIRAA